MSESNLLEEDFDRYVIGFTENHFIPADTNSPTPSEHTLGYNTFAQDYAERTNRGELKIFLDHSFNLDRQKKQSVSKIHTNILDLMFELSERRKVTTPILNKSTMEFLRSDSRFSDLSDSSLKSSSSLPLIEVQQLPPLIQLNRSLPLMNNDFFGLPDLGGHSKGTIKAKKRSKKERKVEKRRIDKTTRQDSKEYNPFEHVRQNSRKGGQEKSRIIEKSDENDNVNETDKEIDAKNVRFSIGGVEIKTENDEDNTTEHEFTKSASEKWAEIGEKLKEAAALAKKKGESFNEYRGRYFSIKSGPVIPKMSFCQSSYQERSERHRMNNIRRRHSSQTNVGPLDFNKLRRQLTIGRSRTAFC